MDIGNPLPGPFGLGLSENRGDLSGLELSLGATCDACESGLEEA